MDEFLKTHQIHSAFYPFFGRYNSDLQPNIIDMPIHQITFDYIKWRPKLRTQMQVLEKHLSHPTVKHALKNRIQNIQEVIHQFHSNNWQWTPIGIEDRYTSFENELHDVPVSWQQAQQIETLHNTLIRIQQKLDLLEKKTNRMLQNK
jgi:hypothetical protein